MASTGLNRRAFLSAGGALLLAGCGTSGASSAPSQVEKPELRLGVLPVPDVASLHIAQREGIFDRFGLRPKMVSEALTGDNRFDLDNGPWDIHFDSWPTIFLNIADGADWVLVGEGCQTGTNTTALITRSGGKVRRLEDIRGARIGINNDRGLGTMLINALLATRGLGPGDVKYVVIDMDKVAGAVQKGEVDAGWLIEPYLTIAELETRAEPVADTAVGATVNLPQSGYVCSRKFARNNPATIKAFQSALVQAQALAKDRAVVEREWTKYLDLNGTVVSLMNIGDFPSSLRAVRPQRVANLMYAQGMLKQPIDASKLVVG